MVAGVGVLSNWNIVVSKYLYRYISLYYLKIFKRIFCNKKHALNASSNISDV